MAGREHVIGEDCWCSPTAVPVTGDDGEVRFNFAHHEPESDATDQAARAAAIFEGCDTIASNMRTGRED